MLVFMCIFCRQFIHRFNSKNNIVFVIIFATESALKIGSISLFRFVSFFASYFEGEIAKSSLSNFTLKKKKQFNAISLCKSTADFGY